MIDKIKLTYAVLQTTIRRAGIEGQHRRSTGRSCQTRPSEALYTARRNPHKLTA